MSGLRLTARGAAPERLDLSRLSEAAIAAGDLEALARIDVGSSRRGFALGDGFALERLDEERLDIVGSGERLDGIGSGYAKLRVTIAGDCGQRLGFALAGATIRLSGSAGPYAGAGARSGRIEILGDAADFAGGSVHGAMAGLSGATLLIAGRAGARLGDRMKGGLIIAGSAGDRVGARMLAGTILAEEVGDEPGLMMRRGTIATALHGRLAPTFAPTGSIALTTMRLLARYLTRELAPAASEPLRERVMAWPSRLDGALERYGGDLCGLAKGEILILPPADARGLTARERTGQQT